jgi:hypothetical protein
MNVNLNALAFVLKSVDKSCHQVIVDHNGSTRRGNALLWPLVTEKK